MMHTRLLKKLAAGLLLAGLLVSPARAETVTYLHTDLLGSVVLETDQNRNVVARYEYEPYGLPRQAIADAPGYTGHVHDAGSGLVYMQQRYYDPEVGRFLSVDPVGVDLARGANFNRYWYGNNNPYTFTDPDGRLPFLVPVAAGAARCAASAPCRIAVTTGTKKAPKWLGAAIAGALGARESMRQENGSAEPSESPKEPIPGAVDLVDDLAGQEVAGQIETGEGTVLSGMGDKKFDPETGTHDKVAKYATTLTAQRLKFMLIAIVKLTKLRT